MYAAGYLQDGGFGSIGFIADITSDEVSLYDPIFGWQTVAADDCYAVIGTEVGVTLPAVAPILIDAPLSSHLLAEPERMAANDAPDDDEPRQWVSGYPLAWERIRHWREQVAPDWRTVALSAIFARTTIQRPIEEAEMLYRKFGPPLRDMLSSDRVPTAAQLRTFKGIKGTRAERFGDLDSYLSILDWAPWCGDALSSSKDYTRSFRDRVGAEWLPEGLGLTKLSFTMMLVGRDAACLDTRMQRYFFGEYAAEEMTFSFGEGTGQDEPERSPERRKFEHSVGRRTKGGRAVLKSAIRRYADLEGRLAETPYFDPDWPMPYAKAQWMLWETLGRTAGPASHSALWEVLDPP